MRTSYIKLAFAALAICGCAVQADETCNSHYMSNLIKGQGDFLYVWTQGVPGMGDGDDDDRRFLWAGGLDDSKIYVFDNTFMDGTTHRFDLSNPEAPKETYLKHTGPQVNMISQSWDGKRVYISSSLLAGWDKKGADDEQFVKLCGTWKVDYYKLKLGRAHHMKLGAKAAQGYAAAGLGAPAIAPK